MTEIKIHAENVPNGFLKRKFFEILTITQFMR